MNKKMEIKILSTDIKLVLPALEAEAIRWESYIHKCEKAAKTMEDENNSFPQHILKSKASLEIELGDFLEARIKQKAAFTVEVEVARREKRIITEDLKRQRALLSSMDSELWAMKTAALRAKEALMEEEVKIKELLIEHNLIRDEIGKSQRDGRGWQSDAFIMQSGISAYMTLEFNLCLTVCSVFVNYFVC